ncbi:MAG TPA: hypothetical protein VLH86_04145 [Patescibacteria group bacterium]|nr:hypothetical protein [Patescibacteria group bacterium]
MTVDAVEAGRHIDVSFDNGLAHKLTRNSFPVSAANQLADDLITYDAQLAEEPVPVARLEYVDVVPNQGRWFRIAHAVTHVEGPSVVQLPDEERRLAVATMLSDIAAMSTFRGANRLRVPIDARAENYHVGPDGPTLVDIFPPLNRRADGSLPIIGVSPGFVGRRFQEWTMGTKSGVMTRVLSSAIDRGDTLGSQLRHIGKEADDWCYDVLPTGLDPKIQRRVRRQIATRFVPYLTAARVHLMLENR